MEKANGIGSTVVRMANNARRTNCRDGFWNFYSMIFLILGLFLILLLIASLKAPGSLLLRPLEARFSVRLQASSDQINGIILLGGFYLDDRVTSGQLDIRSGLPERVKETVRLSKLYPEAKILYSGGGTQAQFGREILTRLGVERERIIIENQSRNTAENARLSKVIAAPKRSEKWLLVTSAFHMPRAVGAFRAAGFSVEAEPVDFRSSRADVGDREQAMLALREYIALLKYWLSGKSSGLFPSP
jgi:uncharacterized SAM-binding protein YcdF (DUF218 family)